MPTVSAHQLTLPQSRSHSITASPHRSISRNFTKVQNILTYAASLSDGAFRTYVALVSFDYQDSATRRYKGAVTLSVEELMKLRGKGRSTLYSHLQELTEAGLIVLTPDGIQLYQVVEDTDEPTQAETSQRIPPPVDNSFEYKVQKSGQDTKELEEETVYQQVQYSVAEDDVVVLKLIKLGFDAYLARVFVTRYGPQRVDQQVTNLCHAMKRGQPVRSFPRWLYTAIERGYTVNALPQASPPKRPKYEEVAIDEVSGVITITELVSAARAD
jgi:DNA-binding transcriptional ArsR family regulator